LKTLNWLLWLVKLDHRSARKAEGCKVKQTKGKKRSGINKRILQFQNCIQNDEFITNLNHPCLDPKAILDEHHRLNCQPLLININSQPLTSLTPYFGQKNLLQKSNPEPGGAIAETIIPLPGHLTIASSCGCSSSTALPDSTTT